MCSISVGKWLNTRPHSSHWHEIVSSPSPSTSPVTAWSTGIGDPTLEAEACSNSPFSGKSSEDEDEDSSGSEGIPGDGEGVYGGLCAMMF